MHGKQHKRMGVAASIGCLAIVMLSNDIPKELAISSLTMPLGSMFPDIDHDRSKLGQTRKKVTGIIKVVAFIGIVTFIVLSFIAGGLINASLNALYVGLASLLIYIIQKNKHIKSQLGFITAHRGIMHTLLPSAMFIGLTFWTDNIYFYYAMLGLAIGDIIHLIGDMGTEKGAPVLWPIIKSNIRYARINTTTQSNKLEVLCNVWCIIIIAAGIIQGNGGIQWLLSLIKEF